jgi:hypothetical protein
MKRLAILFLTVTIGLSLLSVAPSVSATTAYGKTNIMDDIVFQNEASMTEQQINDFINRFPSTCLLASNYPAGLGSATFKTPINYWSYGGTDSTPAYIINWAAKFYHLNPQVILSTLEKEQNLVTGSAGCSTTRYNSAMGYNCPDGSENNLKNYPDLGIYNTCVAGSGNAGFVRQVSHAAWQLRFDQERAYGNTDFGGDGSVTYVGRMTQGYRARIAGGTQVYYDGYTTIDGESVYLTNGTTAALYNYTPHFSSFYAIFTNWFGSAYGAVYGGINYASVFDPVYYLSKYPDLQAAFGGNTAAALAHFVNIGMNEGRQGIGSFDVVSYKNRYQDLRKAYGANLRLYYIHYMVIGKAEGRLATGAVAPTYITDYNGVDYSSVYDYPTYVANYSDLGTAFGNDDAGAIAHFVNNGMNEGRQAIAGFSVISYKNFYPDLRTAFGSNLRAYYLHYMNTGKQEGRIATGNEFNGISTLNGIDYSSVYNFNSYISRYGDLRVAFGNDDIRALAHFVAIGMKEGRQASDSFNVQTYKSNYADLRVAFGNDLRAYYIHYMNFGKREGRVAI